MTKKTYIVARAMTGDRNYVRGDERELSEIDAAPLLASGALVEKKAKPVPSKKAAR